tara:strand:- start:73 stop:462 length:390 start_codon:yes stop_codon:yes gene_type:complete
MGLTTQTLMKERFSLQKSFTDMNNKVQAVENELKNMKNNLNAVHGALQEIEKLIKIDAEFGAQDGTVPRKPKQTPHQSGTADDKKRPGVPPSIRDVGTPKELSSDGALMKHHLDIKAKEEPKLLKEVNK